MTATRTTVDALLKEIYYGQVNNQLEEETQTLKRIVKTSDGVVEDVGGKHVVMALRVKRNTGISYRAENAQLAAPGKQGYARAIEFLKYGYGRFQLTGPVMDTAESNPQSFMSVMDGEMEGLKDDILKDQNRILYGHVDNPTKDTGILAKVTNVATLVFTVDQVRNFDIDMSVDVINGTTGAVRGTTTVTDIDTAAGTVTLAAAHSGATNDYLAREGNYGEEPYGFLSLIGATGTVHNIDSTAAGNEYWRSTVDSSTNTLTEQAMLTLCDNIRLKGGKKPTAIFCSLGVRRAYFNIMLSLRRYMEPRQFDGGLVGLSFNHGKEIPLVDETDCPSGHAFFVNESDVKVFRNGDWKFEDKDGAILKWKDDYDVWQGLMKCYWNLGVTARNSHGVMTAITEPTA
jgi:hypothetical protein